MPLSKQEAAKPSLLRSVNVELQSKKKKKKAENTREKGKEATGFCNTFNLARHPEFF